MGRSRRRAAWMAASRVLAPAISSSRANSTIRMAFLQARPISTNRPIWVKILLSPPVSQTPVMADEQAHRHDQDDRQRQEQAFILGGQHQEDQQHADRKHQQRRVAGQDLLIGQIRPFEAHALGQGFVQDFGDRRLRLAGGIAGRGAAIEIGGAETVIAHGAVGTGGFRHLHDGAERHHLRRRHCGSASCRMSSGLERNWRVGLRDHLIGAAEFVEVVDILRAQIDLHGIEDILHIHAQLHRLGAVEIGDKAAAR